MARVTLLALLTLLVAACGRDEALGPFAESRVPPSLSARFYPPEGWAWGFIRAGAQPVQRYGVGAPPRVPRAVVVITPGYGESAEVWFETARELIEAGYTVWILDRAGQGGSARYAAPRDLGIVTSFGPDVANLRNLVRQVVRPEPDTPVVLIAYADGFVVATRALQTGLRADGLIAVSPALASRDADRAGGGLFEQLPRLARRDGWSREAHDDRETGATRDAWRGAVRKAWQLANPDLRMAAASSTWRAAYAAASRAAEGEAGQVRAPVLALNPIAAAGVLCRRMADCRIHEIQQARPALHLEADAWRSLFMQEVSTFIEARVTERQLATRAVQDR